MTDKKIIHSLIEQELKEANEHFPQFASDHEAWAVVREDLKKPEANWKPLKKACF